MANFTKVVSSLILLMSFPSTVYSQPLAFPTAEGYGKYTVGGWPELESAPAPVDSDKDGMPDAWEIKYGFDPSNPADGSEDKDGDGYTNVEEYLNGTNPTVFVDYTKPENNVNTLTATTNRTVAIPDGYATLNGGTTGGGDATPVVVTTAGQFRNLVGDGTPRVIVVQGRIDLGSSVSIGSNKTIIGADAGSGLYGGRINVGGRNYIFQNLILGPTRGDIMEISGGTNVFVHKCEFVDCTDESLSIVRGADFVTVSWCKFHFTESHSHAFGHLIGNRTDRVSDRGKLHTTMHHNWYGAKVRGRMPRVRYGHVHIYNNYYNSPGNNYCIGVGHESHIRLENSHFENVDSPWTDMDSPGSGEIGWTGLKFVGCSQPTYMPNAFPVFTPPYAYTVDPVDEVKAIVTAGAGNVNAPRTSAKAAMKSIAALRIRFTRVCGLAGTAACLFFRADVRPIDLAAAEIGKDGIPHNWEKAHGLDVDAPDRLQDVSRAGCWSSKRCRIR
jgi:pectate lyase